MPRYFSSISPGFVEEHFSQKNTKYTIVRRKTHFKHFDRILGKVQATLFKCSLSICTYQHCHYPATTAGVSFVSNPSNRSRQVAKPSLAIDQVPALPGVAPPLSLPPLYILLTDAGFALTQSAMFSQFDLSDFLNLTPFPVHINQSH